VELGGGARGVILLHESPADLCGWAPDGETLAERHFHVLLVDLRNFGLSHRGAFGGAFHGWDLLYDAPQRKRADRVLTAFLRRATA